MLKMCSDCVQSVFSVCLKCIESMFCECIKVFWECIRGVLGGVFEMDQSVLRCSGSGLRVN